MQEFTSQIIQRISQAVKVKKFEVTNWYGKIMDIYIGGIPGPLTVESEGL